MKWIDIKEEPPVDGDLAYGRTADGVYAFGTLHEVEEGVFHLHHDMEVLENIIEYSIVDDQED